MLYSYRPIARISTARGLNQAKRCFLSDRRKHLLNFAQLLARYFH
jgi:hypothetical protein